MNKNYQKGRRKEYKIVKELREKGFYIAQRTAGSHSEVDVLGVDTENMEILLIQAKPNSMSENQKKKIIEKNKKLNGLFKVSFLVQ